MPELPEVETTMRGVAPLILENTLGDVVVRVPKLRWEVPEDLLADLVGARVVKLWRRSKYLLVDFDHGLTLILHLGMSGRLVIANVGDEAQKHEHVQFDFSDMKNKDGNEGAGVSIRLRDPRKFGAVLVVKTSEILAHKLFVSLGPEPLEEAFTADYLWQKLQKRKMAVKPALMDAKLVVGVGNIYANEALFRAGILPMRACNKVTKAEVALLQEYIIEVLEEAIVCGGSSLKDFAAADGKLGYFHKEFSVYDRAGAACVRCDGTVEKITLGGRGTYFCGECQG